MKFLYTAFLLIFCVPLFSQTQQIAPIQGNPILRSHVAKEDAAFVKKVETLTGHKFDYDADLRFVGDCPTAPPDGVNAVQSGSTIIVDVDTFGLGQTTADPEIMVVTSPPQVLGTAVLLTQPFRLSYTANPGQFGILEETVYVSFSEPGNFVELPYTFTVTRAGETIILPTQSLAPEEVTEVCLDGFLNFDAPLACAEILECIDDYPGEGDQFFYLSSYPGVDTCLIYQASRFPGIDTVCVKVCDEFGVCDEFKIPFSIQGEILEVTAANPFFDDFSSYDGPYPSIDLWLDRDAYVNNTLAKDPPSVGFATFDGLNRRGQPYDIDNSGIADQMTSKQINLSGFTTADVLSLRYFVAPKGYGQEPEAGDTLKVEFLNDQGKWVMKDFLLGEDFNINDTPPFELRGIAIDEEEFLHDLFQFRYTARVSPGGYGDWWHIDYVYLGAVEADNVLFNDVAFTTVPNGFLKNYTAMPFKHYKAAAAAETGGSILSNYYNHFDDTRSLTQTSVTFTETTSGTSLGTSFPVVFSGTDNNIAAGIHEYRTRDNSNESDISTGLSGLGDADLRKVETKYSFVLAQDAIFEVNDVVSHETIFSNYFAHDDGTAEQVYFIQTVQGGEQVATKYRTNVEDSIHAVQIMFPHFSIGEAESQLFNLRIWIDENGDNDLDDDEMVYERELLKPFFADAVYDTLQGFTTYILDDFLGDPTPLEILKDKDFYVGWEYGSSAPLSFTVGLDVQTPCECVITNTTGLGFEPLPFPGALMVRPVMKSVPFNTSSGTTDIAKVETPFNIYPNPNNGLFNLKLDGGNYEDFKVLVFNQLGQLVAQPKSDAIIDLGHFENGLYYFQISDKKTGQHFVKRIIIEQ